MKTASEETNEEEETFILDRLQALLRFAEAAQGEDDLSELVDVMQKCMADPSYMPKPPPPMGSEWMANLF